MARLQVGAARKQIDKTARLIQERHQAFDRIPEDLPVVGVVTTAQQFYLAGTPFSGFASTGAVPATTMSLRDLEFFVGFTESEAAALVIQHPHPDGEGGRFGGAFDEDVMKRRNTILEEAWHYYDFVDTSPDS